MSGRTPSYANISAILYSGDGDYEDLVVNELHKAGKYKYTTSEYSLDGSYYLDVSGGGSWKITFTPM